MRRTLHYDDAVRALQGDAARIQQLVDLLVGVGMLALVGPFKDVLGWFDAKAELSRITERLIAGLVERRGSLSRYERTDRLRAAHVVLASAAFFEVMAETELPLDQTGLRLDAADQQMLTRRTIERRWEAPVPGAAESHVEYRARLLDFYRGLAAEVVEFGAGLAVWDGADSSVLDLTRTAIANLPEPAVMRFESLLGRLAGDFPEIAFWASVREQTAIHARLRDVTTGLIALGDVLHTIASGRAPDERRVSLARAYAAALDRPISETGEVPAGLALPTLGEAFVPQRYRTMEVTAGTPLSNEDWWRGEPIREDLLGFLTGQLTSPDMTIAPMLLLGQPGSGKSVLARVLAGRLPPTDFLPVLVALRSVYAGADVQEQIEQAIRADTGERVDWPALARSAGDALPVVILDGFDELLQATGVSQTDYLQRVEGFQRREAEQGRPVAVMVTSRISVADRAYSPQGSVAVRLEPFDRSRVGVWLDTWNRVNTAHFGSGTTRALDLDTVLRYPELAGQPLLLLMLAIYDAEGNDLRAAGDLRPDQLYERLLERFVRREVDKQGAGLPVRERNRLIEAELSRLSVVAFAMFNRGAQWVTEEALDTDLLALPGLAGADPTAATTGSLRTPVRSAELALGSFFFVYRARAAQGSATVSAYEFLHATFGEFLVARLIHRLLRDMLARDRATTFLTGTAIDDNLLRALLSFAPFAARRQIIVFARGMATDVPPTDRADWAEMLVRLFRAAQQPRKTDALDGYVPRNLTVPARIAAYTSNLLTVLLCVTDSTARTLVGVDVTEDPRGTEAVRGWKDLALLWHSQAAATGWSGLMDLVQVDRVRHGDRRDVALSLSLECVATAPPVDMNWVLNQDRPEDATEEGVNWIFRYGDADDVRRETHFTCDVSNDFQQHAIEPLHRAEMTQLTNQVYLPAGDGPVNLLGAYLSLLYDRELSRAKREALYRWAAGWASRIPGGDELLLRCLQIEFDVDLGLVASVVAILTDRGIEPESHLPLLRCVVAHLDPARGQGACEDMAARIYIHVLETDEWTDEHLDAALRIHELSLGPLSISAEHAHRLLESYANKRPDFVARIGALFSDRVSPPALHPDE